MCFIPLVGVILGIVALVLARKAVRERGRDGKATAGKVCGIIGIVFSVLVGILSAALFGAALSASDSYSDSYETMYGSGAGATQQLDAEESAVFDAAAAEFDKPLNRDAAFMAELADEYRDAIDESFGAYYGVTCDDLGINPVDVAEWAVNNYSYEIDSVYVDSNGTASVYIDTVSSDYFDMVNRFVELTNDYATSTGAKDLSAAETRADVGKLFYQAMEETSGTTTYFAAVEFEKHGSTWAPVEDSLEEEFEFVFGTF